MCVCVYDINVNVGVYVLKPVQFSSQPLGWLLRYHPYLRFFTKFLKLSRLC